MTEHQVSLRCPDCGHHLVADIDIEAWVTKKAYEIVEKSLMDYKFGDIKQS